MEVVEVKGTKRKNPLKYLMVIYMGNHIDLQFLDFVEYDYEKYVITCSSRYCILLIIGIVGTPKVSAYSSSKHALQGTNRRLIGRTCIIIEALTTRVV